MSRRTSWGTTLLMGIALSGCSSSRASKAAPDAGTSLSHGDGAPGAGGGSGSRDSGADRAAPPRTDCPFGQAACGGQCFSTVGEQHGTCTLVALPGDTDLFGKTAWDGQSFYSVTSRGRLVKIDKTSGQSTELGKEFMFRGLPVVDTGYVYVNADYISDAGSELAVQRLPASGGALEFLVDPYPNSVDEPGMWVIDGTLYYTTYAGLQRMPVAGGSSTLVVPAEVDSLVADSTYFYYHSNFPEFDVRRVLRSDTSAPEEIMADVVGGDVFLWPSDPDHVYVMADRYLRSLRSGGTPETLLDRNFTFIGGKQGKDHLLLDEVTAVYAVSPDGKTLDVIDHGSGSWNGLFEEDSSYYLVGQSGIFRVPK